MQKDYQIYFFVLKIVVPLVLWKLACGIYLMMPTQIHDTPYV